MTVQVEPRAEECFYEELEIGVTFVMEFEVIRGGLLDIDFKLMNPSSQIVFQKLAFFNNKYAVFIIRFRSFVLVKYLLVSIIIDFLLSY